MCATCASQRALRGKETLTQLHVCNTLLLPTYRVSPDPICMPGKGPSITMIMHVCTPNKHCLDTTACVHCTVLLHTYLHKVPMHGAQISSRPRCTHAPSQAVEALVLRHLHHLAVPLLLLVVLLRHASCAKRFRLACFAPALLTFPVPSFLPRVRRRLHPRAEMLRPIFGLAIRNRRVLDPRRSSFTGGPL